MSSPRCPAFDGSSSLRGNSSFTYQSKVRDVRSIADELGVRYLVEGNFRIEKVRVRVSTKVIEVETGADVLAEQYDRELGDLCDLQDEITSRIACATEPSLDVLDVARCRQKRAEDIDAYDLYRIAQSKLYILTQDSCKSAEILLRLAIEIDPLYSHALAAPTECVTRL